MQQINDDVNSNLEQQIKTKSPCQSVVKCELQTTILDVKITHFDSSILYSSTS